MREHKRKDQRDAVWLAVSAKIKTTKCHFIFIRNNNVLMMINTLFSQDTGEISQKCFYINTPTLKLKKRGGGMVRLR